MSEGSEDNEGLLEYLGELIEHIGFCPVVSRREQEGSAPGNLIYNDLPIVGVMSDEGDGEICILRQEPEGDAPVLDLESFYRELKAQVARHPNFKIVVSEWFRIDEEHRGRIDTPLREFEVDKDAKVARLLF